MTDVFCRTPSEPKRMVMVGWKICRGKVAVYQWNKEPASNTKREKTSTISTDRSIQTFLLYFLNIQVKSI